MFKKGDTLVEVMLAIGIFSMVAISVVAVLSSSTAGAENSLETTLTREEIDSQADALRFIQTAASADNTAADSRFNELWLEILKNAVVIVDKSETEQNAILKYSPTTCAANEGGAYDFSNGAKPFILDLQALGRYASATNPNPSSVVITNRNLLQQTQTYPRLVYNTDNAILSADTTVGSTFSQAAGIYIVAVADPQTTEIISGTTNADGSKDEGYAAAYYDFYIRTCWYSINSEESSTISTVVRLHDPNVIKTDQFKSGTESSYTGSQNATFYTCASQGTDPNCQGRFTTGLSVQVNSDCSPTHCQYPTTDPVWSSYSSTVCPDTSNPSCHEFVGWQSTSNGALGYRGAVFAPGSGAGSLGYEFYAKWDEYPYIEYYTGSGRFANGDTHRKRYCPKGSPFTCQVASDIPTRSGYQFVGWATASSATDSNSNYDPGTRLYSIEGYNNHVVLYAVWTKDPEVDANGGSYWNTDGTAVSRRVATCTTAKQCRVPTEVPTRSGYGFLGYSTSSTATTPDSQFNGTFDGTRIKTVYAVWREQNEEITVTLSWPSSDLDSHIIGYDSGGKRYHAYFSNANISRGNWILDSVTGNKIAGISNDATSGGTEVSTIYTLGGKDYYFYVHNYTSQSSTIYGATVTVKGTYTCPNTCTYYSNNATIVGSGGAYWNVFSLQNGRFVVDQTRSYNPTSGVTWSTNL